MSNVVSSCLKNIGQKQKKTVYHEHVSEQNFAPLNKTTEVLEAMINKSFRC